MGSDCPDFLDGRKEIFIPTVTRAKVSPVFPLAAESSLDVTWCFV